MVYVCPFLEPIALESRTPLLAYSKTRPRGPYYRSGLLRRVDRTRTCVNVHIPNVAGDQLPHYPINQSLFVFGKGWQIYLFSIGSYSRTRFQPGFRPFQTLTATIVVCGRGTSSFLLTGHIINLVISAPKLLPTSDELRFGKHFILGKDGIQTRKFWTTYRPPHRFSP